MSRFKSRCGSEKRSHGGGLLGVKYFQLMLVGKEILFVTDVE